jgi:hypothetical protein
MMTKIKDVLMLFTEDLCGGGDSPFCGHTSSGLESPAWECALEKSLGLKEVLMLKMHWRILNKIFHKIWVEENIWKYFKAILSVYVQLI